MQTNETYQDAVENYLTPTEEEQEWRILKGLCPHNKGWEYDGHGHNCNYYRCVICGEIDDY